MTEQETTPLEIAVSGINKEDERVAAAQAMSVIAFPRQVDPEASEELLLYDVTSVDPRPEENEAELVKVVLEVPVEKEWVARSLEEHSNVESVDWLNPSDLQPDLPGRCEHCGSQKGIVEYYNTEMDAITTRQVLNLTLGFRDTSAVERIDCANCTEVIYEKEE